jgi:hypothetical protein
MSKVETLPDRLECELLTIIELSKILANNAGYVGCAEPAQISATGEGALHSAITFISEMAHNDFCNLMNSLEESR